ncbi:MAG: NUDIX hydrolase [Phycisphaerae bacterium]|nr:NUDIX hydrolase [Phycisphaerae bacterium]
MTKRPPSTDRSLGRGRRLELIDRGGWEFVTRLTGSEVVGIVAWTAEDELLLVEQDRPAVNARTIELPAGLVGDEPELAGIDTIERAAARELLEETGCRACSFRLLWRGAASSGLTDEMVTLMVAEGVERVAAGGGVGTEEIVVHAVSRSRLLDWLAEAQRRGAVIDIKVGLALLVPSSADDRR